MQNQVLFLVFTLAFVSNYTNALHTYLNCNYVTKWAFAKYLSSSFRQIDFARKLPPVLNSLFRITFTAWKVSKYGVFFGPYFPEFGLNMELYSVNLRIQSEYRKIRTRKNSVFRHFSRSVISQQHIPWKILFDVLLSPF